MWPALAEMGHRWAVDPTYSHGYLVPLAALLILWFRRERMPALRDRPNWWGVALVAVGVLMQVVGVYIYFRWLAGAALLAYLAGVAVLIGGWPLLRWAAPAIGVLIFMVPLPFRVDTKLLQQPLKLVSARSSCFALQALGVSAMPEGTIIVLSDVRDQIQELGVVDACSGLKMFLVFFCLATVIAILTPRSLLEKVLIVLSAAPIAIICNVARITATGVLYATVGEKWANLVFHDLAGWLMMPLALGLLWCELRLFSLVFADAGEAPPAGPLRPVIPGLPPSRRLSTDS